MRESDIENYLVKEVRKLKGEIRKVMWVGRRGAPDRVIFLKGCTFVELKAPGKKPSGQQDREHMRMRNKGVDVWIIDSFNAVDCLIQELEDR